MKIVDGKYIQGLRGKKNISKNTESFDFMYFFLIHENGRQSMKTI